MNKRIYCCASALLLCFISIILASADILEAEDFFDMDIETLMEIHVTSASKREQTISEAPSSITVVTAADIERYGYRTIADVLKATTGFYHTNDRVYDYIGVRGFSPTGDYNTRLLIMIDGHKVNDCLYSSGAAGNEFGLDLAMVDRIEIVRGPGSALYGTNAFFGMVNVITKTGADYNGAQIATEFGSNKSISNRITYGTEKNGKTDFLISATRSSSDGEKSIHFPEFDTPMTNAGIARNCDGSHADHGFISVRSGNLSFYASSVDRKKIIPTAAYGMDFNNSNAFYRDQAQLFGLKYRWVKNDRLEVQTRLFYDSVKFDGDYPYLPDITSDYARGRRLGSELQVTHQFSARNTFIWGLEFINNVDLIQKILENRVPVFDSNESSRSKALFIQNEYLLRPNLLFNFGLRLDDYDSFGSTVNPRFALINSLTSQNTVKLFFGKAFRAPNTYELFYNDNYVSMKDNPGLNPETIKNYELILERRFDSKLSGTISCYKYEIDNLITQITDPLDGLLVYRNREKITAHGMELELRKTWTRGTTGRLGMTIQRTRDVETGDTLVNSPRTTGFCNLSYPIKAGKTYLSLENIYSSSRKTKNKDTNAVLSSNLTLTHRGLWRNSQLSFSVSNLFNNRIYYPASEEHIMDLIPQPGRTYRLTFSVNF